MNPVFTENTPRPSTMAFTLKQALEAKGLDLKLHETQAMVAQMLGFKNFETLCAVESKSVEPSVVSGNHPALVPSSDHPDEAVDWKMNTGVNRVYVDCDVFSVYLTRNSEGLVLDVYPAKADMSGPIHTASIFRSDVISEIAEEADDYGLTDVAKMGGVDITRDSDQPGLFCWKDKRGNGSEVSFDTVKEAFEDAMEAIESGIVEEVEGGAK